MQVMVDGLGMGRWLGRLFCDDECVCMSYIQICI